MSSTGQVVWCGVWIRSFLKLSIVCVHRWEICLSHRISGWWNLLRVIKIVGMMHETNMTRLRHDDKQGNNNYLLRKLAFKVFFSNQGRVILLSFETNIKFEVMKETAYSAYWNMQDMNSSPAISAQRVQVLQNFCLVKLQQAVHWFRMKSVWHPVCETHVMKLKHDVIVSLVM